MKKHALLHPTGDRGLTRYNPARAATIQFATLNAVTNLSSITSHAVMAAQRAIREAEAIQLHHSSSPEDAEFVRATHHYLTRLTLVTEAAGADILYLLHEELRPW